MFEKYSADEGFALIFAGVVGTILWGRWYYALAVTGQKVRPRGQRWPLAFTPLACGSLVWGVLKLWSAEDVRTDAAYILFYLVMGAAWLGLFRAQLPLFGLSARDEVLERGNNAAGWVCVSALLGGACCFAGANVGNGPGWWVVLFSALLATAALLFFWWVVDLSSGLADKVTIERDPAAGLRAAGLFIGGGLILGRGVAGDWVSASDTVLDFARMAWPALALAGIAVAVERSCRSSSAGRGFADFSSGWVPATVYVAAGVVDMLAW